MAIYRSDQALVTFGAEAAHGGYQELIEATSHTDRTTLAEAVSAGARSVKLTTVASIALGDYLRFGYETNTGGSVANGGQSHSEIRRVIGLDGTGSNGRVYLDSPMGFSHANGQGVVDVTVSGGSASFPANPSTQVIYGNAIKFIPGIYDTVDVPDMETTFSPTYALGSSAKRNATFLYKGEQAFNGSIPAFSILNGWPLRFPIGKVTTTPSDSATLGAGEATIVTNGFAACGADDEDTTSLVTWNKGDMIISLPDGAPASADIYDALTVNQASGNRNLIWINHSGYEEVIQVAELLTDPVVRLSHPLRFDHQSSATVTFSVVVMDATDRTYTHTVAEQSDLDSVSMHVHLRDSGETAANDFDRRFYGGRIGTSVIAGEETGRLTMSWDGMQFMGMTHNQQLDSNFGSGSVELPRFNMMKTITDTEAWVPSNTVTAAAPLGVAGEPYLFSQGTIKLFGVPIATIRSFALTINNSPEARYYIGGSGSNRNRGPYEIINQRREYSLAITAVEPVSRAADANAASVLYEDGLGSSVFKELLMEGDKDNGLIGSSPEGLAFEIFFSRDSLTEDGGSIDYIKIENGYVSGTTSPAFGLSKQGMFIQAAKYNLDGSSPIQADLDIILRSVQITVVDKMPIYP